MYAQIIVDISHEKLDRIFEYRIPEEMRNLIKTGTMVNIPFGKGNRMITGYVTGIVEKSDYDESLIKDIDSVVENAVTIESELIELAGFIRDNFGSTMNQALKTVIPVKKEMKHKENKTVELMIDEDEAAEVLAKYRKKNAKAKVRLMEELLKVSYLSYGIVTGKLNVTSSTIKAMTEEGVIRIKTENILRNPVGHLEKGRYSIQLNEEQRKISENIKNCMNKGGGVHLIHGITGSGKTEIYIDLIEENLKMGKQAIVMIPEIALTYQTVMRFYKKFGDKISIINSKLSQGERYDQFERAKNGDISIMIGPRSSLFTPFANLGLIIIDEEHEGAYKSESVPKYHAREVAEERIRKCNGTLVLGSATPSVESYYKALEGKYTLHKLEKRAGNSKPAEVEIVDLREELEAGNRTMFSRKLDGLIRDRLSKDEQIMLFINRRGYAGFVSCRKCGYVVKCPHCDVSLTAHNDGKMKCHYCGYSIEKPQLCPKCQSKYIGMFGTGTQKVEEAVKKMYPQARVLRMDLDTTSKKGGHEEILAAFANHDADILIGTQMIVKGHDFPNVTLVGIIAADLSLYASDYKAAERTFELLTQAVGRAGRGSKEGVAVIQTYNPEEYSVAMAAEQDYEGFYRHEIGYRKLMDYPPVTMMLSVLVMSVREDVAVMAAELIKESIENCGERNRIIGPAEAGIYKINDIYRRVIYVKNKEYEALVNTKNTLERFMNEDERFLNIKQSEISVQFDFNPMGNV
ncbi:MAG: primosomal protein N' [Lachnospiraceae bacterium]|nr:primosomal protein N' [Lachnospiraceae bacterium]